MKAKWSKHDIESALSTHLIDVKGWVWLDDDWIVVEAFGMKYLYHRNCPSIMSDASWGSCKITGRCTCEMPKKAAFVYSLIK